MKNLTELRSELDNIDKEMATLFEKRMNCIEQVRIVKNQNNYNVLDSNREKNMTENNKSYIQNQQFVPYYEMFLNECLFISKQYMKDTNEKNK